MAGESAEDWLVESLRLYNDLHVFELQEPTRVIEWIGEKSVCVAGYENSRRNEILQLLLPQKLCVKEKQGLCPERDFKVERGGFSDRPVYSLRHVPDTSLLVTSGPPDSSLQVWQLAAEDTGVIKSVSTIPTGNDSKKPWAKIATTLARTSCVLHGSRVNNVQITEIESKKNIYTADPTPKGQHLYCQSQWLSHVQQLGLVVLGALGSAASSNSNEVSGLEFLDCNTWLACCVKGQLCLADVRQPQSPLGDTSVPSALSGEQWCMGVSSGLQGSDVNAPTIARLSSGGQLTLTDLRNIPKPLKSARCKVSAASQSAEFLCVSWAPVLDGCLAVSGFNGTVHIYDTRSWPVSGGEAESVFSHKGHIFSGMDNSSDFPLVTTHAWHPWKPRMLLSAASDGSLHVWDWAESHKDS
ncbi:WD repeat-containing protein 73 isoform X2 [Gopherus evgoodei]|uniref:WD repeat-containing protein 73 isoform X2 n=1 Tax=Gopherus evgoodei TaxID=1825980 RepID=UPI0011CEFE58|nr:WD repeat-containing protein 73 isoform X2 [Gopherus evgoodei]